MENFELKEYRAQQQNALSLYYNRFLFSQLLGEYAVYMCQYVLHVKNNRSIGISYTADRLGNVRNDLKQLLYTFKTNPSYREDVNTFTKSLTQYEQIRNYIETPSSFNKKQITLDFLFFFEKHLLKNYKWAFKEIRDQAFDFFTSFHSVIYFTNKNNTTYFYHHAAYMIANARLLGTYLDDELE